MWTLPLDISVFASLPFQRRCWNWQAPLRPFPLPSADGGTPTEYPPFPPTTRTRRKPTSQRKRGRIAWPDDLEFLVLLWAKPQKAIARDFDTIYSSVSEHAKARALKGPKSGHWIRLKQGLPVEIPEVVLKAREELLARQKAAGATAAPDSTPSPSTPRTTQGHDQKSNSAPQKPESEDHVNPS